MMILVLVKTHPVDSSAQKTNFYRLSTPNPKLVDPSAEKLKLVDPSNARTKPVECRS